MMIAFCKKDKEVSMKKQSSEGGKHKHLTVVKPKPAKTDWSVPYPGCEETGRAAFEYEGEILNVIV